MRDPTSILNTLTRRGQMSFQDIIESGDLGKNRNKAHDRLEELIDEGLVRQKNKNKWEKGQKLWHVITPKGERLLLESETENLKKACRKLQEFVELMVKSGKLQEWRREGDYIPGGGIRHITPEERTKVYLSFFTDKPVAGLENITSKKMFEIDKYKEKTFGDLRSALFGLAWVWAKLEGPFTVRNDLSNFTVEFKDNQPSYRVPPIQESQSHILLEDGDGVTAVEKPKFEEAARSGKTIEELLEQERKERAEKRGDR